MTRNLENAFGWVNGGLDSQNSRPIGGFTGPGSGEPDETSDDGSREIEIRFHASGQTIRQREKTLTFSAAC